MRTYFSSHAECGPLRRLDFVMGPVGVRGMYKTFLEKAFIRRFVLDRQESRKFSQRQNIATIDAHGYAIYRCAQAYAREGLCHASPFLSYRRGLCVACPPLVGNARAFGGRTSKIQTPRLFLSVTSHKHSAPQGVEDTQHTQL